MMLALFFAGCPPPPVIVVNFTGPADIKEDATADLSCTADDSGHPAGLASLRIIQSTGSGALAPDSDPDPKVVARQYNPNDGGKSRQATFTCVAAPNTTGNFTANHTLIVRDAQIPAWNPNAPVLPAAGADGDPPGKIGVVFNVIVDAKDDGLAGLTRGVESGIHRIILTGAPRITINPAIHTTQGVPPGPPTANAGPLQESQTFQLTCTAVGAQRIGIFVDDTAGNELTDDLDIECYAP